MPRAPSFKGLRPASRTATAAARGSSGKSDTQPEVLLRKLLFAAGRRFRKNVRSLPGVPDIVFQRARIAVFCDGDFWHGRDWSRRRTRLLTGNNPRYWIAKIEGNMDRDLANQARLEREGWRVLRFWESEIRRTPREVADEILAVLDDVPS